MGVTTSLNASQRVSSHHDALRCVTTRLNASQRASMRHDASRCVSTRLNTSQCFTTRHDTSPCVTPKNKHHLDAIYAGKPEMNEAELPLMASAVQAATGALT